mmetsp:Transcript_18817/g.43179  ORF Transcript_18817/g.43179 Transcript_18817/m.43179 type:complete len:485 (+) Transcript_18817:31-1485(+)
MRLSLPLFVAATCATTPAVRANHDDASVYGYGAIIDAGSSGSRIYLYKWPVRNFRSLPPPLSEVARATSEKNRVTPGISSPDGLAKLPGLVEAAKALVPRGVDLNTVPLYLGATAGMRVLHPDARSLIMAGVREALQASGFLFKDPWARVLSGEEEGAFGWLSANYLLNKGVPDAAASTLGALDLGGASTQITFRPSGDILANFFPLEIVNPNHNYDLYTHSFLYYGSNEARLTFDLNVLASTSVNPCYPAGYTSNDTNMTGSSEWTECLEKVKGLFQKSSQSDLCNNSDRKPKRCSFNGVYQPVIGDKKFIGMSAYVYAWRYLRLETGKLTSDLDELKANGAIVCAMDYEEQKETAPPDTFPPFLPYQCFVAAYSYQLLSYGYGMPTKDTPVQIYETIDGSSVEWSFGMMLFEANKLSWNYVAPNTFMYLFAIICPILVLLLCGLAYLLYKAQGKSQGGKEEKSTSDYSEPLLGSKKSAQAPC